MIPDLDLLGDCLEKSSEANLSRFIRWAWPTVHSQSDYVHSWHIDCISEYLDACFPSKQIKNLLITIPPRHMKSMCVSVFWPVWIWCRYPQVKFLTASYGGNLAIRDALRSRRLIESPWYQKYWGEVFKLTGDQNVKSRYENDHGGERLSLSVGGGNTGEGGDINIVDDAHNMEEIHSTAIRESTLRWWDEVFYSRVNDPQTAIRVVIGQRGHEKDLPGHLLEQGGFTHVNLPATAPTKTTVIFPRTHREIVREEGDILWPQRFPKEIMTKWIQTLGHYGAAAQLQQTPVPSGGGIVKTEWWKFYKPDPKTEWEFILQSWDTAFKTGEENDYSVCTTWGVRENGFYMLDVFRDRLEFPQLCAMSKLLYSKWKPHAVLIEDKASGQSLIQKFQQETALPIIPVKVDRDKVSRVHAVSPLIQAGRVFLPEDHPGVADFVNECALFPLGEHDDAIDSFSQALNYLSSQAAMIPTVEVL